MAGSIDILLTGAAAVVDTVLLLALAESRNRSRVPASMVLLIAGLWLWHAGSFVHLPLAGLEGPWALEARWCAMTAMGMGLLLLPSAMIHLVLRLDPEGYQALSRPDRRSFLLYLPVGAIFPVSSLLAADPRSPFLELLDPLVLPYLAWLSFACAAAAAGFLRLRSRGSSPRSRQFLAWMAILLLAFAGWVGFVFLVARRTFPAWSDALALSVVCFPVVPAVVFAYFVIRFNFMQLILERTLVYGAVLVCLWLFHQIALGDLTSAFADRYHVDFGILEGAVLIGLVIAYPPLRSRAAEALRYLMGSRVAGDRERVRRMTVELSSLAGEPHQRILSWFVESARELLGARHAAGWLFDRRGGVRISAGDAGEIRGDIVSALHGELSAGELVPRSLARATGTLRGRLEEAGASFAMAIKKKDIQGLLLFGRRRRNRELCEEESNALLLLVEQLGVTLENSSLLAERLCAERRALQAEKLSALGLLSSSIAHEVKNPLSSIKTIAAVLAEELGPESEHAEELRLILGEVDRLAATTSQLLEFARPPADREGSSSPGQVLLRTLGVLRHLARQRDVSIEARVDDGLPSIAAGEDALREIFFNLITNSIDAAGRGGRVDIACSRRDGHVVVEVRDDGPGIPPEVQDRLFEPFVTTKETGTGLGLYVAGRRVRELYGEIHLRSGPGQGTSFTVKLPVTSHDAEDPDRRR